MLNYLDRSFYEAFMKKTILTMSVLTSLAIILCLGGCHYLNQKAGLEDENIVEEVGEYILEQKTGISVDFTPNSPEK